MTAYARRTWIGICLCVGISVEALIAHSQYSGILPRLNYISGWALFLLMLALTLFNARKKLPFLPLGTAESWLHYHIYAGFIAVVIFLAHINFRLPTGRFECILAWLYVLVTVSGIAGWFISRSIPKRLTTRGGEVLFERIPAIRRSLREKAETLALKSVADASSPTIANFYVAQLKDFFDGPQNLSLHLFEIRRPVNSLLNKISDLNRFLDNKERETLEKIADLVRQKDGLDYHYALQFSLKSWLFIHIPLTYSLLIFSVIHIVLVYAFAGGTR